jgi:hypothetical protein
MAPVPSAMPLTRQPAHAAALASPGHGQLDVAMRGAPPMWLKHFARGQW